MSDCVTEYYMGKAEQSRQKVIDEILDAISREDWTPQRTMSDMVIRFKQIVREASDEH